MAQYVGDPVATSGTTWQTLLGAPASGKRRQPLEVKIVNRDTVAHTLKVRYSKGATQIEVFDIENLAAGKRTDVPGIAAVLLNATDETLEIQSDAPATTTEPEAFPSAFEEP